MQKLRPYVLTIAGFDPSGGAGILADVKTFEQCKTLGLAVNTAQTLQTEDRFFESDPMHTEAIEKATFTLLERYPVKGIKIGWMADWDFLITLVIKIKQQYPKVKILWDPIAKASSAEQNQNAQWEKANELLPYLDIITPNYDELLAWSKGDIEAWQKALPTSLWVLQKGGHDPEYPGRDLLYQNEGSRFQFKAWKKYQDKHGTGCILSAALLAYWIHQYPPKKAYLKAKKYLENAIWSNPTLLAYHQFD